MLSFFRSLPAYGLNRLLGDRHAGHLPVHSANDCFSFCGMYSHPQSTQIMTPPLALVTTAPRAGAAVGAAGGGSLAGGVLTRRAVARAKRGGTAAARAGVSTGRIEEGGGGGNA